MLLKALQRAFVHLLFQEFATFLSIVMKKTLFVEKHVQFKTTECKNHTPLETLEMAKINTLFLTKMTRQNIPFGVVHTYIYSPYTTVKDHPQEKNVSHTR